MLWLTAPVLLEQVLHLLVQYVDFFLTGHYLQNNAYLAAMTLVLYAGWFISNLFSLVGVGAAALVARLIGAGDKEKANEVLQQSLLLGLGWCAVVMALVLPNVHFLVLKMNLEGNAAAAAAMYLRYEFILLPAIMIEQVGIACLRGAGDTRTGLVVMTIVNIINAVLSYALLVGFGPLPVFGWQGLLIGTAVGHVCGALLVLFVLSKGQAGLHLRLFAARPNVDIIWRILRIGIPAGIDSMGMVVCHLLFIRVINGLGETASAAHGIAIQVEALAYLPTNAFGIAAATLAGQYLGAGDPKRAKRSILFTCLVCAGGMCLVGLSFYNFPAGLVSIFLGEGPRQTSVFPLAIELLRTVAVAIPAMAVMVILQSALRGAGDTRWPMLFTFTGLLLVRLPLAYYFALSEIQLPGFASPISGLGLGVLGAWYAMLIDVFLRCFLVMLRFWHGGWIKTKV